MTEFLAPNFNHEGSEYQLGINSIERAALAGLNALQDKFSRNAFLLEDPLNDGFDEELDEEGVIINSEADSFAQNMSFCVDAQHELCRAFVLAAYHFWERSVVRWFIRRLPEEDRAGAKGITGFKKLVAEANKIGLDYSPHPDLQAVSYLTNLLKHESKTARKELETNYPLLWADLQNYTCSPYQRPEGIVVSLNIMRNVFDVIRQSGPVSFARNPRLKDAVFPKKESPDAC